VFKQILNSFIAKRLYRSDQFGIMKRYLAEKNNWDSHLASSKKFILENLPQKQLEKIAILGSGWLLDVPINSLLEKTEKLFLFDISHPQQIKNKYEGNSKVEFVKLDLTNNLINLLNSSNSYTDFYDKSLKVEPLNIFYDYDFVISLNLLNQLDIILCDLIQKRFNLKDDSLELLRRIIQTNHIKSLPQGKAVLIVDYEEINFKTTKHEKKIKKLLYCNLPDAKVSKEWIWNFDTKQNYHRHCLTNFKVRAISLI